MAVTYSRRKLAPSALPRPTDKTLQFVCSHHQTTHAWSSAGAVCRGIWRKFS